MSPRIPVSLAFLIGWCSVAPTLATQVNPGPSGRRGAAREAAATRVEIIELRQLRGLDYQVRVGVSGEASELQLLIFAQDLTSGRFGLAVDTIGKSRPPGFPYVSGSNGWMSEWMSVFTSAWGHPSIRVFAIACELGPRARWDRDREFRSLRDLPFGEVTNIHNVLQILADYQWRPVGYTFLDAPH